MKSLLLNTLASAIFLTVCAASFAQVSSIQTSYFKVDLVNAILELPGCTGIRMYPVIDNENGKSTIMIIGINANGNELYNGNKNYSKYQMFKAITGTEVIDNHLDSGVAESRCSAYSAKNPAFVSEMDIDVVRDLLRSTIFQRKRDGVVINFIENSSNNFKVQGYHITRQGAFDYVGQPKEGDPCPVACETAEKYLCSPN